MRVRNSNYGICKKRFDLEKDLISTHKLNTFDEYLFRLINSNGWQQMEVL